MSSSASFSAIVVSHDNEPGLRKMLGNLLYQSKKPDETLVFVSGVNHPVFARLAEDFPHARFHARENREDWGHEKRAEGLALASKDWLGFFNDDDSYDLRYLERMLDAGNDLADVVYCGWNTFERPEFKLGMSTSGNFIVRTPLAKRIGYGSRKYEADGHFIDALRLSGARISFVPEVLYHHNYQP